MKKKTSKSSRMEMGLRLPELEELEILSKLPVKSLVRFRCVCKSWSSSFQTSYFIAKHHRNNNNNLNLILNRGDDHGSTPPQNIFSALSTTEGGQENFIVAENIFLPLENCRGWPLVCNGLICFVVNDRVAFWNPSTREFKVIPESTLPLPPSMVKIIFDCFGFGFDSTTDDYKVVRSVGNLVNHEWTFEVELYSLKTDSWKEISLPAEVLDVDDDVFPSLNNYSNGFCYWVTSRKLGQIQFQLLSFDMTNEKFSILPLPNFNGFPYHYGWEFLDFNGLLGSIRYSLEGAEKTLDLWLMKNGSWTRQFSIDSIPGVARPLGIWKDGQIFLESLNGELVLFDPATKDLKNLGIIIGTSLERSMRLFAYVESLVPINGRSEYDYHIIRQRAKSDSQ